MRSILYLIVSFSLFVLGCSSDKINIEPSSYLDSIRVRNFKNSIIRYTGDLPEKGNYNSRFDVRFDEHYQKQVAGHNLEFYLEDTVGNQTYFLLTRIAPSLTKKYVAIGGKLKIDQDSITYYEEVFRTWKMPEDEQLKISEMLFRKMVKGEDLSKYYSENSGDDYIIEFPNEKIYYDTDKRTWLHIGLKGKEIPNMLR